MSRPPSNHVIFAYDGSEPARAGILAAGAVLDKDTPATVLTVWEPLSAIPFWGAPVGAVPRDVLDNVVQRAERVAAEGVDLAAAAGFSAKPLTLEGSPVWREIVQVATERDAALIVLGSHGRTGLNYVLAGSVATAVMQHAPCSVLIGRSDDAS